MKYTPIDIPWSRNFFDFKEIMKSIKFFFEQLKKVNNYCEFLKAYSQIYIMNIEAKLDQQLSCD